MSDEGSGSVLMFALLALAGLLCLATADAANVLMSRARAQNAADAAALAAAAAQWPLTGSDSEEPADVARRFAEANDATLESCGCERHGEAATVRVSVPTRIRMLAVAPSRVEATARASVDVARLFDAGRN